MKVKSVKLVKQEDEVAQDETAEVVKIKLLVDIVIEDVTYEAGSILEVDKVTANELIEAEKAVLYTEEEASDEQEVVNEAAKRIKKEIKSMKIKDTELAVEGTEVKVIRDAEPQWKGFGEFLGAVVKAGMGGKVDDRLKKSTGQNETTAADGGYTVTTDLAKYITQQASAASVVEQKCSHLEIGANYTGIKIPQSKETVRSSTTLYGGVRIYSPNEGVAKTAFKDQYHQKDIQLKKLCAVNYITDELLQDNTALEGFIRMNVGKAFAWVKDNEIINGTLSTTSKIVDDLATEEVTVVGNSPTPAEWAQIYTANCNRNSAEWFLSSTQYAALIALATTGTFPLYQPNYAVAPLGTLLGRPINVIEQAGAMTDESSVMFLDLKDYLVIGKGGIDEATSIHVKFLEDETCFRWTTRFGGAPMNYSVVRLPDGSDTSSFVTRN